MRRAWPAVVTLTVVAAVSLVVWSHDRSSAARLDRIDRALTECRTSPPAGPSRRHPFLD
jgi:hypothetical protein